MMADSTNKEMTHAAADALVDEQKGKAGGLLKTTKHLKSPRK
ncbi:hypothetical protein [Lacticaseibacillus paracasei]|nr:hypothetical protein [Lacticaseibacillus paracasei]